MSTKKSITQTKKNVYVALLLAVIMIAGLARFCYAFYFQKEDVHSDETWSYGLANSYYEPYIYTDADETYNKNICFWVSGDVLKDYVTVQPGQRFAYDSVYYNLSKDLHPPLYFFILHTICSFFPNTFSFTYGFIINLFSYVIMSIFLFKLIKLATNSNIAGLIGVAFNTFTSGTLSITVFIRMYAMSVMFAVMLTYYIFKIYCEYRDTGNVRNSSFVWAAVSTLLGALTHHFFLVYAFIITAVFTIYYLIKKAWKPFLKLALFMLGAVGISIALFPSTITHVFGNGTSSGFTAVSSGHRIFDFRFQLSALFMHLSNELFGFSWITPLRKPILAYFSVILLIAVLLLAGIFFLFRREKLFQRFIAKVKRLLKMMAHPNIMHLTLFLSILFVVIVCARTIDYAAMMQYSDRYMFVIFPIATAFVVITTHALFSSLKLKAKVRYPFMMILTVLSLVMSNIGMPSQYVHMSFNQYGTTLKDIAKEDSDVIIMSSAIWLLTSYSERLVGINNYFYTVADETYLTTLKDSIDTLDSDKPLYLVIDVLNTDMAGVDVDPNPDNEYIYQEATSEDDYANYINTVLNARKSDNGMPEGGLGLYDYLDYVNSLSICKQITFAGCDSVFQRPVLIYKLN